MKSGSRPPSLLRTASVAGVLALELGTGKLDAFGASAVVLATGGAGRVYTPSTASQSCCGDGMSLAYRAGLGLRDMEMVQYHPLGFCERAAFASEGALGEGAVLCNPDGQPILQADDPPLRDALCRSLASAEDGAILDFRSIGKERIGARFLYLERAANDMAGISLDSAPLPVMPRMHRVLGGIQTDTNGGNGCLWSVCCRRVCLPWGARGQCLGWECADRQRCLWSAGR